MPAGVLNGNSIKGERRAKMILALSQGRSQSDVARSFHCDRGTVAALERAEFNEIQHRKSRLAAQAERIATRAADLMLDQLNAPSARFLQLNALVAPFGVAVDKLLNLRGEAAFTVNHNHTHRIEQDDLLAFALARSEKRANARVIPPKALKQ